MDPQAFIRLSVGSLGLRTPLEASRATKAAADILSSPCSCEIRLRGFPVQVAPVPLIQSFEESPDPNTVAASFYLEQSTIHALLSPGCFRTSSTYLEILVFSGRQGYNCGANGRKQQLGSFRLQVCQEWGEGRAALLHSGWTLIRRKKHDVSMAELHLRVKIEPDPRYVFQFENETALSPQIVQLQGNLKQPIFSCKFIRDRRATHSDQVNSYWSTSGATVQENERRERKGWRVTIHDLSGSAIAAASMVTPFVPITGSDQVARSNPGAWLLLRPNTGGPESWHPWGRLEAWRERLGKDSIGYRFHLVEEAGSGSGVTSCGLLVSENLINAEKGGEFSIDTDRQMRALSFLPSPQSYNGDSLYATHSIAGGFVMNCQVQGEGKSSKPTVHLAMRHVKCVEDAAIFMALAAAVDLSVEASRPFRRKLRSRMGSSF